MSEGVQTAAELFVACLEAEGVEYVFGVPGEENLAFLEALRNSKIRFITISCKCNTGSRANVNTSITLDTL